MDTTVNGVGEQKVRSIMMNLLAVRGEEGATEEEMDALLLAVRGCAQGGQGILTEQEVRSVRMSLLAARGADGATEEEMDAMCFEIAIHKLHGVYASLIFLDLLLVDWDQTGTLRFWQQGRRTNINDRQGSTGERSESQEGQGLLTEQEVRSVRMSLLARRGAQGATEEEMDAVCYEIAFYTLHGILADLIFLDLLLVDWDQTAERKLRFWAKNLTPSFDQDPCLPPERAC